MNDTVSRLTARNADFARHGFVPGKSLMPALRTIVISCVDSRVDPAHILGLADGEAMVIRNVGGRWTPGVLQTMAMLGAVGEAEGLNGTPEPWNLIVVHHTDCGST